MALPLTNLLARYIGGTGITNTGSGISTWNDQSGNGHHVTQTVDASRPVSKVLNGLSSVYFGGTQHLDLPSSLTINRRSVSVFVCCRTKVTGDNFSLVHFDADSTELAVYLKAATDGNTVPSVFSGSQKVSAFRGGHGVQTVGCTCGVTNTIIVHDGNTTTVAVNPTGSASGGFIGKWNGNVYNFIGDIYEIVIYNAELGEGARNDVIDYFAATYRATARTTDLFLLYEGDSFTEGSVLVPQNDKAYPFLLASSPSIAVVPKWFNDANGGAQISAINLETRIATEIAGNTEYGTHVAILWAGTNDINNGRTSAQIIADLDTWIAAKQALGATVYVLTILDSVEFLMSEDTVRSAVNTHLRTAATADGVIDVASDVRLSTYTDLNYFQADQWHPNEGGTAVVAELVLARLLADGILTSTATVQYARPNSDVTDGGWTNEVGSGTNLFESINEELAIDTDYIISGAAPIDDACTIGLNAINPPGAGVVRIRIRAKWL